MVVAGHGYALDTTWRTLLKDIGVEATDVLRRARLPEDLLEQPSARLEPAAYYALWGAIEAEAGDPLLPIRLCEAVRSEAFSPPLFAALCSPNLLAAARRVAQYKLLIAPILLSVAEERDAVTLTFAWLDAPLVPPTSLAIMELLFSVALARMGTRERIRPLAVVTTALPSPIEPYDAYLGTRMRHGDAPRVVFARGDAVRPFLTSNVSLWLAFEPELRTRLADLVGTVSTARRVRAALLEGLPSGLSTVDAIAGRLALSKRTLQRRIEADGTSFNAILRETRESLARHYLQKTDLPTAEIAFLLGFDEPNSFYRAFSAWTGTTPSGVRHVR